MQTFKVGDRAEYAPTYAEGRDHVGDPAIIRSIDAETKACRVRFEDGEELDCFLNHLSWIPTEAAMQDAKDGIRQAFIEEGRGRAYLPIAGRIGPRVYVPGQTRRLLPE